MTESCLHFFVLNWEMEDISVEDSWVLPTSIDKFSKTSVVLS